MPVASITGTPTAPTVATLPDVAQQLAAEDNRPARKSVYLTPLRQLQRSCKDRTVPAVGEAVEEVAHPIVSSQLVPAPRAAAAAALVAEVHHGSNCHAVAAAIAAELGGRLHSTGSLYRRLVRFSPPLTAELALAAIRHSLPGQVHVVYALTAFSCQQAIFMGPALAREYGNSELGAFVELTSGKGVGHGKYDANRVNRARITPFGSRGGQPCT